MVKNLSPIIDIREINNMEDLIDLCYDKHFKMRHMKEERPNLYGKKVIIPFTNPKEYKFEIFWHLISLDESEHFNVFPCGNDLYDTICKENCFTANRTISFKKKDKYGNEEDKIRRICPFRAMRINWVLDIIHLANSEDKRVKVWTEDSKIHLRYKYEEVDFIVILVEKQTSYRLITAFPVFYINKKKDFDKAYKNFKQKKSQ